MALRILFLLSFLLSASLSQADAPPPAAPANLTNPASPPKPMHMRQAFYLKVPLAAGACKNAQPWEKTTLLLNGIDTGLHPLGCEDKPTGSPDGALLTFYLQRDNSQKSPALDALWQSLQGSPWKAEKTADGYVREVRYAVIPATPVASDAANGYLSQDRMKLVIFEKRPAIAGIVLVVFMWGILIWLGRTTDMLRAPGDALVKGRDRSFSLARVQMAWWFALVLGAYVFLYVMTGDIPTLSGTILGLMGLSSASSLISAGVDSSKTKTSGAAPSSGYFFQDLVTDAEGITLHRFQMVAMTITLGLIFIYDLVTRLTLPEFDESTLAMMGISAGTYLGFKVPEKQAPAETPAEPAPSSDAPAQGTPSEPNR